MLISIVNHSRNDSQGPVFNRSLVKVRNINGFDVAIPILFRANAGTSRTFDRTDDFSVDYIWFSGTPCPVLHYYFAKKKSGKTRAKYEEDDRLAEKER